MADPAPPDRPKSRSLQPLRALLPFLAPLPRRARCWRSSRCWWRRRDARAAGGAALPDRRRAWPPASADTINRYFVAFLAAAAVFGVFAALRFYLVTWLGERVVADMREAVYRRVIRMDPTFFEVTRTGEVLSRLTTDTTLVQSIAGVDISITLRSATDRRAAW